MASAWFSRVRSSVNTAMSIVPSIMLNSQLPFAPEPSLIKGRLILVSIALNDCTSSGFHPAGLWPMISAARGHISALHAACKGALLLV